VLVLSLTACKQKEEAKPPPPPEVKVVVVKPERVPVYLEFVGQIFGQQDIPIRARVEGFLEGIHFKEGYSLKKGDLLYTIESQQFEEAVAAKMSAVAEAQTNLARAKSDLRRIRPLAKINAVSQSDLDAAVADYEAAKASLEAADANLRAAKIHLGYTKIYSPIDGIIGKTQAKVGEFVGKSPNPVILNAVSNIEKIRVEFFLTENQYLMLARRYARGDDEIAQDRLSASEQELEMVLADGSLYDHKGTFDFIDREVDPTTGAILIQATFPNPENLIRPGQFARVRARADVIEDGILIPQRCVVELQGTYRVYVVDEKNRIQERDVTVGSTFGGKWLVEKGLSAGEKVVYEGLQKIKDGAAVKASVHAPEPPKSKGQ
jgi:membrane fusion protein (multidrug efflux system)